MRSLLSFLFLLALAIAGLGYYLEWFTVSTDTSGQKVNINVTVDKNKVKEDEGKAKQKLEEAGKTIEEKTKEFSDKLKKKGDTGSNP